MQTTNTTAANVALPPRREAGQDMKNYVETWKSQLKEMMHRVLTFKRMDLDLREWADKKCTALASSILSRALNSNRPPGAQVYTLPAQLNDLVTHLEDYMVDLEDDIPVGLVGQGIVTRQARFDLVCDLLIERIKGMYMFFDELYEVRRASSALQPTIYDNNDGRILYRGSQDWQVWVDVVVAAEQTVTQPPHKGKPSFKTVTTGHVHDGIHEYPFSACLFHYDGMDFHMRSHIILAQAALFRKAYNLPIK